MTIDLHMHTTASDGDFTPAELIRAAHERSITILAITDHDTTDGIAPAKAVAAPLGITIIPAIELSAETDSDGDIHMLGYFLDYEQTAFQQALAVFVESRYHRGEAMVRKLNALGIPVTFEAVQDIADGAPITRPHIARALVQVGAVENIKEAFNRYIAREAPAYVNRQRMTPEEAVDLIHSVGGAAVMAHPGLVKRYEPIIERLAGYGLDGVEMNHPKNPPEVRQRVQELAARYDLVLTGGSDFHRPDEDGVITLGQFGPPAGALEQLRSRARQVS